MKPKSGSHGRYRPSLAFAYIAGTTQPLCAGTIGMGSAVQWQVEDGGNGHYYETVLSPDALTWEAARDRAISLGGHLATLTSDAEDTFVFSLVASRPDLWQQNSFGGPWLGGFQAAPFGSEPSEGWEWVTGEAWSYTNWAASEPNDAGWQGGVESYLQYRDLTGGWNDFTNDGNSVFSFVVEYSMSPVPAPNILAYTIIALSGPWGRRRRSRFDGDGTSYE
jgi:hypothetical protein